jgi:bacterioferritin (cytochrome b1)
MLDSNNINSGRNIERRLAEALANPDDAKLEAADKRCADNDLSSRELLQMAWDRAEQEIDELRTQLRIMQQRHRESERCLISRINQRKRLKQQILQSASEPAQVA